MPTIIAIGKPRNAIWLTYPRCSASRLKAVPNCVRTPARIPKAIEVVISAKQLAKNNRLLLTVWDIID
jgi:hypothetical protein